MTSIYPSSTSSSTNSSTSSANLLRISGMASGIDTDSVVKSMVSSYQAKIDKANQSKQTLQWKQEAYRDIIKDIKGLQDYFDPLSDKYMLSSNSLNTNTATSGDTSIVSATAASTAKAGTYNVKVSQLATQAKIEGTSKNTIISVTNGSEWSGAKLTIGSKSITLDSITDTDGDGTTLDQVAININSKISEAGLSGISAEYVSDSSGSYIKFANNSGSDVSIAATTSSNSDLITLSPISNGGSVSSQKYTQDASNWSGATLTLGSTDITLNSITDTNGDGSILDEVVANINKKISSKALNGKVSASYVNDGTNSYIKFINTSDSSVSVTAKSSNNFEFITNKKINSGISSSSKLVSDLGFSEGTVSFDLTNVNTKKTVSLNVSSSTTMQDLMNAVNSATSGAITLSVDDTTGKISFQSQKYGSASSIKITADSSTRTSLGLTGADASGTITSTGTDAIVAITAPGQSTATTTTQSSNQFTVNGVSYNIVGVDSTTGANITVTGNTDKVVSNMKKFIDDYNSVISKINTKLTEKSNKDYKPLTDDQKASMSESQITAWETKAKAGILRNDDYLNTLLTQVRGTFSAPVYSDYSSSNTTSGKISLSFGVYGTGAIGIDTSKDYTDGGKLVLRDESKLKAAIENNSEEFKKLFTGASTYTLNTNESYIGSKKYNEDGIFKRLDTILRDYVASPGLGEDGTYTLSGSLNIFVNKQYDYSSYGGGGKNTLPDQVHLQTINASKYETQLKAAQTRYYAKFTALETAMSRLNSQQSQLSSMLGTS